MRLSLLFFLLALTVLPLPSAFAQEGEGANETTPEVPASVLTEETAPADTPASKEDLARTMHDIWLVRPRIEDAIERIALQINQMDRLSFKSAMRQAINFEQVKEDSIQAMAEIFTQKELEAMVAFYGSKEGRSIVHKLDDYQAALEPIMTRSLDKALLDMKLGQEGK